MSTVASVRVLSYLRAAFAERAGPVIEGCLKVWASRGVRQHSAARGVDALGLPLQEATAKPADDGRMPKRVGSNCLGRDGDAGVVAACSVNPPSYTLGDRIGSPAIASYGMSLPVDLNDPSACEFARAKTCHRLAALDNDSSVHTHACSAILHWLMTPASRLGRSLAM